MGSVCGWGPLIGKNSYSVCPEIRFGHAPIVRGGSDTRKIYDMMTAAQARILAQLRTGMRRLNSYLSKIGAAPESECLYMERTIYLTGGCPRSYPA